MLSTSFLFLHPAHIRRRRKLKPREGGAMARGHPGNRCPRWHTLGLLQLFPGHLPDSLSRRNSEPSGFLGLGLRRGERRDPHGQGLSGSGA